MIWKLLIGGSLWASAISAAAAPAEPARPQLDCHIGFYRLADGSGVDIGAGEGQHLRWRRQNGETGELTHRSGGDWTSTLGWTRRRDGKDALFGTCGSGRIRFDGVTGNRVRFDTTE